MHAKGPGCVFIYDKGQLWISNPFVYILFFKVIKSTRSINWKHRTCSAKIMESICLWQHNIKIQCILSKYKLFKVSKSKSFNHYNCSLKHWNIVAGAWTYALSNKNEGGKQILIHTKHAFLFYVLGTHNSTKMRFVISVRVDMAKKFSITRND